MVAKKRAKPERGRPCKLKPALQKRLCKAIAAGNYYQTACASAGISYKVFRDWMKRGAKDKSGEFRDFRNAVLKAVAQAETSVVALWRSHMPDNWQACRDFLARRFPKQWTERQRIEQQTNAEYHHTGSIEAKTTLSLEEELKPYAKALQTVFEELENKEIYPNCAPESVDTPQADAQASDVPCL